MKNLEDLKAKTNTLEESAFSDVVVKGVSTSVEKVIDSFKEIQKQDFFNDSMVIEKTLRQHEIDLKRIEESLTTPIPDGGVGD